MFTGDAKSEFKNNGPHANYWHWHPLHTSTEGSGKNTFKNEIKYDPRNKHFNAQIKWVIRNTYGKVKIVSAKTYNRPSSPNFGKLFMMRMWWRRIINFKI